VSARALRSAAVAAVAARLAYATLRDRPPGGADKWTRTNHRGEPITLLEGPAAAIGGVAGALSAGPLSRSQLAIAVAGAGAAAFGSYDDLAGNGGNRGFRGHLGALRKGELTTGAVKIAGIGATGVAAALIAGASEPGAAAADEGSHAALGLADRMINAGLIAGTANLLNLFDLRPGRAIKVSIAVAGLLGPASGGATASAAPLAAALALLPEDLGERSMLGDAGANALGAMLGAAAATSLPRRARLAALAGVVGLTAASEVVSFTKVIERTGPLRWLDMLGRRPGPASAASGPAAPAPAATGPAPAAQSSATPATVAAGFGPAASSASAPAASAASGSATAGRPSAEAR
jgi:hypothetical protein